MDHCRSSWLKANSCVDLSALSQALEQNGFKSCEGPFQMTGYGPRLDFTGLTDSHGPLAVRIYDLELGLATEGSSILEAYVNVYDDAGDKLLISHAIAPENYPAYMDVFQSAVTHTLQGYRSTPEAFTSKLGELIRPREAAAPAPSCLTPVAA